MSPTYLKNYKIYLHKIEKFAKDVNIKIFRSPQDGDGCFNHWNSHLHVDPDLDEADEISTLLHELGHAFDYHLAHKKLGPKHWRAYEKVYENTQTKEQLDIVVAAEVRAWEIGKLIAKYLKIPLGKWYARGRKSSLLNYRST